MIEVLSLTRRYPLVIFSDEKIDRGQYVAYSGDGRSRVERGASATLGLVWVGVPLAEGEMSERERRGKGETHVAWWASG